MLACADCSGGLGEVKNVMKRWTVLSNMHSHKVALLLLLGVLIREIFSFWTGHPSDFELWVRLGYAMSHDGNPYGVLPLVPGLSFADVFSPTNGPTIAYLPFWPLVTGLMYVIYSHLGFSDRFAYYFLLKQPVIVGDVSLAYLLYSYVSARERTGRSIWVLRFWLLCPFTIIISGVWGMFDSIAMAFVVLSMMLANSLKRGIWTGLGIFAKSIPIIYAAPVTLKEIRKPWGFFTAIALPALFSLGILAIAGWPISIASGTLMSTASKGGESMSLWDLFFYFQYLGVMQPLTPIVARILGLLWVPALLAITVWAFKRFRLETDYGLVQALLVATLAFLIFKARVTEQYSIYLFALSAVDVAVWNPKRKGMLLATMAVVLSYLVVNNYFLIRFLSPVYPNFVQVESALFQVIGSARYAADFLLGGVFTILNLCYLIALLKPGR
jgi:hypothetical protein